MALNAGDYATHQQNLVSLFEVARTHHQQLTSFSILVVLGALGFALTDTFRHVPRRRRVPLAVAVVAVELVIGFSLYENGLLQNRIIAEAAGMDPAPGGAPDIKTVLRGVGDTPALLLLVMHASAGVFAGVFMLFIVPARALAAEPGAPGHPAIGAPPPR